MADEKQLPDGEKKSEGNKWYTDLKFYLLIGLAAETAALCILGAAVSKAKSALKNDEEYISAISSRVFEYYGERDAVYLDDPTYGQTWLQALTDVPKNTLDYNNVKVDDKGFKSYWENDTCLTKTGIDVSYHNGEIDWEAVKNDGIEFVMLRMGYRGYESGKINIDDRFHEYAEGASAAGLDVGIYFYSQAVNVNEARDEARTVLDSIGGYSITYPVVFDWEMVGEKSARTNDITAETLTDCAAAFCNAVAEEGYIPMIYSVKRMALMKFDLSRLAGFDFWLAEYRDIPEYPYEFQMWQYASDGKVSGIKGDVDMNMSFVDYSKARR